MKVNSLEISGFRGIRKNINLDLSSGKSVLIYGDNGSGKSSIVDAFEWFYYDKVKHLTSEEIDIKTALRNTFLSDDKDAYFALKYSDSKYDSEKKLFLKKSKLTSEHSNDSQNFKNYLNSSLKENLILRYKDLLRFILSTKLGKLEEISQIIGFSEVSKVKGIFKTAVGELKKVQKIKDYNNHINIKQRSIMEQIGQSIFDDNQYFNAIKELVAPLNLSVEVKDDASINNVLELLMKSEDKEAVEQHLSYEKVIENLSNFKTSFDNICLSYKSFYERCQQIAKDQDKLKKISLESLLSQGVSILEERLYEEDRCPLCLQDKNREELIDEIRKRLKELSIVKEEKEAALDEKNTTQRLLHGAITEIEIALKEKSLLLDENSDLRKKVERLKRIISTALDKLQKTNLSEIEQIGKPEDFVTLDVTFLQDLTSSLAGKKAKIVTERKDEQTFTVYSKIFSVRQSYDEIKSMKRASEVLTQQQQSMELIYNEFVKKQREGLCAFLDSISRDMNDLYLFMNASENVSEIKLIPLDDQDNEFVGITLQFNFHGKPESPPHKYLSESHLNCLGICLFLASVKAFNKLNKFIILDDVISSFDTSHRSRFARLLVEKFSDYQIVLLTHEKDWFKILSNMVKEKNWVIKSVKWSDDDGAYIDKEPSAIKEEIENKIKEFNITELGNLIRKYLERFLKEVCFNLEVKMEFRFNEHNEDRMSNELLSELKSKLKNKQCELKEQAVFERLNASMFLGNTTSHDSTFTETIDDLKMFYDDVLELEGFFRCSQCHNLISSKKHYDSVENVVRCSCGNLKYAWKK